MNFVVIKGVFLPNIGKNKVLEGIYNKKPAAIDAGFGFFALSRSNDNVAIVP